MSVNFLDSKGLDHYTEKLCKLMVDDRNAIKEQLNALQDYTDSSVEDLNTRLSEDLSSLESRIDSTKSDLEGKIDSTKSDLEGSISALENTVNNINIEVENFQSGSIYFSSGTFVVPTGVTSVTVVLQAGGGGGAGMRFW